MKSNQNHEMSAGETKSIAVACTVESTGAAVNFTSATATWIVKRGAAGSFTTYITKTLVSGITASGGTLTISLATGDTTTMSGVYAHECRATLADGTVATLFTGTLTVRPTLAA